MISITLIDHGTKSRLATLLGAALRPEAMMAEVGRRGANELKTHFRSRNRSSKNKLGGRRTGFWRQVADSVQNPRVVGSEAIVSITHPAIAQKVFGGTIKAKVAGALSIPLDAESYGRRPSVFERETGIKLFKLRKKGGGISNLLAGEGPNGIRVFYVLVKSVTQTPDKEALPPKTSFQLAIIDQAEKHLRRQISKA